MSWGPFVPPNSAFAPSSLPADSGYATHVGTDPNFTESQGINPRFGDLMYDEFTYDEKLDTYDYHIGGRPVPNRIWTNSNGSNTNWTTEVII